MNSDDNFSLVIVVIITHKKKSIVTYNIYTITPVKYIKNKMSNIQYPNWYFISIYQNKKGKNNKSYKLTDAYHRLAM